MKSSSAFLATSASVGVTALVGTAGTDITSRWYRQLDKPPWQPPGPVFGAVWTVLYVLLAVAGGRALTSLEQRGALPAQRRAYLGAYAANLVLNAGWTWVFFRARRPLSAVVEAALLAASTADLTRRTWRLDPTAGAALLPYASWATGATALSAEIMRRNP
jgi:translocator protein